MSDQPSPGVREAVVVGSGPNGLVAAVVLARAGVDVTVLEAADEIGGGTRSAELTRPGILHDICSAIHPMGIASPAFRELELDRFGLRWQQPAVAFAHPLDDGTAAVLHRSVDLTDDELGAGGRWRRTFGPLVDRFPDIVAGTLAPIVRRAPHPLTTARFGLRSQLPATVLGRRLGSEAAAALFMGSAAHLVDRLDRPLSAAPGVLLTVAGHAVGWPVAKGGSAAIARSLAAALEEHGGRIEVGTEVTDLGDLPEKAAVFLDTGPAAAARIIGDHLPDRTRRAYTRWQHGPASFKVDLAVAGGVPWTAEACRTAGTVHVGGSAEEIVEAENAVTGGHLVDRPFTLVAQQYLADPARSDGDVHPVWAYCHVPHRYDGDATDLILDQIERFAPGTRSRIIDMTVTGPAALEAYNANYVGGDIAAGRSGGRQMIARPRLSPNPYATGVDDVYLCSAATAPGAGVHGMCGYHAATTWLSSRRLAS